MKWLKRNADSGFTLVELLIVIVLIGLLVLVVLAAINPIEQTRRARDTRYKADAAQLLAAIDRYFTNQSEFPWVTVDPTTYDNQTAFPYSTAADEEVGICGIDCTANGVLIAILELKEEFLNRDFLETGAVTEDLIYVGKDASSTASAYGCYVPASLSVRTKMKSDSKVWDLTPGFGVKTQILSTDAACDPDTPADWTTIGCTVCVPE